LLEDFFGGEFGAAIEFDGPEDRPRGRGGRRCGPKAVAGREDEGADASAASGIGEVARAVDVGCPDSVIVDLFVSEHRSAVHHGVEMFGGEERFEQSAVADVAADAGEMFVAVGSATRSSSLR